MVTHKMELTKKVTSYTYMTCAVNNQFRFHSNALDIIFPFGTNNFIPNFIEIQNNGMSQANADATINNIVTNASDWDIYSTKNLNIGGDNASPSGSYQAPPGNIPIRCNGK